MSELVAERVVELVRAFRGRRLLVLGDFMVDRYVWGSVDRISPESPVPVVVVDRDSSMLGGAGNVARNLASLGAEVRVVTLAGQDEAAQELRGLLAHWGIPADGLVVDRDRPTTQKTRVIARSQQVVRYDRESDEPISAELVEQVLAALAVAAQSAEGVIIEDYAKGMLTPLLVTEAMKLFASRGLRVFVDPKQEPWEVYRGAELVKPNLVEAEGLVGARVKSDEDLQRVGRAVLEHSGAQNVAITRGKEGMDVFSQDGGWDHFPAVRRSVSDLAGAGDTAIAVLSLARLSGASWPEAAWLANAAAGFVVGVLGTATLTPEELISAAGAGT